MPVFLSLLLVLILPLPAFALLPPDIIFSVGSSVVQFFSIAALVVGGIFSSLVYAGRRWFLLQGRNVWFVITILFFIVCLAIAVVCVVEMKRERDLYRAELLQEQEAVAVLDAELRNRVPRDDYLALLQQLSETHGGPDPLLALVASTSRDREFYSNNITLYGQLGSFPFALEIDFNRIEQQPGVFTHYTYMSGNLLGESVADYAVQYSTSTELLPNRFVRMVEHTLAGDLSPRGTYALEVQVDGAWISVEVDGLEGDFITRDRPSYLQHQSVGEASLVYQGGMYQVNALVEAAYSNDYAKHIFFEGRDTLRATTHQFVLWDEAENFYLIDVSEVHSDTPEYPSHIWLLYKEGSTGVMEKSFTATIEQQTDVEGKVSWEVSMPDLAGASMTLLPRSPFKQVGDDRIRSMVVGTIRDDAGERSIEGVLHLIE
jgi:hypothetical protein